MLTLLFSQSGAAGITGTLDVTESIDVVAFSGDFPVFASFALTDGSDLVSMSGFVTNLGWVPASTISSQWTSAINQPETWTPVSTPSGSWVDE